MSGTPADATGGVADGVVDGGAYRAAMSRFATGVTVITTVCNGVDHAMTATSVTSVSLDPPLALFCVQTGSRFGAAVLESGIWAICVLPEEALAAAQWFSTPGRPVEGQFGRFPYVRGRTGCPLLAGSLATVECRTTQIHPGGDHDIVVGGVQALGPVHAGGPPLLRYQGAYLARSAR